jgi:FSR family fosmidomycin resistance protein-like MFS transporter
MAYKSFLTFLPTYLVDQGAELSQAGVIASIMFLAGFVSQPLGGYAYDRFGGRWVLAISALVTGSAIVLFSAESPLPLLIPVVLLGVAVAATFPVSLAMAGDMAGSDDVGMNVGIVFGLSTVLAAVTPLATGYAADIVGLRQALQWLVVLPAAAFLVSLLLPEP